MKTVTIFLVAAILATVRGQSCKENEKFRCETSCEETCDGPDVSCMMTKERCTDGCFCQLGYVRRSYDKRCVKKEDC